MLPMTCCWTSPSTLTPRFRTWPASTVRCGATRRMASALSRHLSVSNLDVIATDREGSVHKPFELRLLRPHPSASELRRDLCVGHHAPANCDHRAQAQPRVADDRVALGALGSAWRLARAAQIPYCELSHPRTSMTTSVPLRRSAATTLRLIAAMPYPFLTACRAAPSRRLMRCASQHLLRV